MEPKSAKVSIEDLYKIRKGVLNAKQCKDIVALWPQLEQKPAEIYNDTTDSSLQTDFRQGEVAWIDTQMCPHWPRIRDEIIRWNLGKQFALNGRFSIQLARYTEGSKFKKHQDISIKQWSHMKEPYSCRKISASIQLSNSEDYEGGDFLFFSKKSKEGSQAINAPRTKGDMFMFPSYCEHAVDTVTSGERFSLVIWAEGPFWR